MTVNKERASNTIDFLSIPSTNGISSQKHKKATVGILNPILSMANSKERLILLWNQLAHQF
jgi:hypothetical protein